jgi:hypothetical protein
MLSTRQAHLVRIHEVGGGQYAKKQERKNETQEGWNVRKMECWNIGVIVSSVP